MIYHCTVVEFSQNSEIFKNLLEGQRLALKRFGLEDFILTQEDLLADSGMFGVIAFQLFLFPMKDLKRLFAGTEKIFINDFKKSITIE